MQSKEKQGKIIRDFTKGSIPKAMLRFSVPFMLSNALQVFYAIVDMIVVGNIIGSSGLSAVSTASQVFTFMTMLCLGFSTGGQVFISQIIGSGQKERLNRTIGTLFGVVAIIGACMTVLGLVFYRPVLRILNTPAESYSMASDYMIICSIGILFTYGYNMISAVLRGMGDSRHPFIFIVIASLVNLVLDLLFVAVFDWGVGGAALATILGQAVSFIYAMIYLYRQKEYFGFDFKLRSFIPDRETFKSLASLGIPFALQSCAINISMMFVTSLVNSVGVNASAVFGVGLKIDDIINKITQGLTFAASSMVGQNVGARDFGRTRRTVWYAIGFAAVCYGIFTIFYLAIPEKLFALFTSDEGVIGLSRVFVNALVWSFPAMAIMRGSQGFIQGIGHAKLSLFLAILDGFVIRILFSYLFGIVLELDLFGFFLGYGLAAYGTAIPGLLYFLFGKWKERTLLTDKK